jgi:ABC-2 type transport system permease protein
MSRRIHQLIRFFALATIAVSAVYMAQRSNARMDATAEGLSEITPDTRELIGSVATERPVVVTAYVSKEVPRHFVALRSRLLNILREMEAESAGTGLTVRIYEPELHSEEGQEAVEKYGIIPRSVMNSEGGRVDAMPVFLGVAFSSGPREEVIPFLDRGLSVEYEIARALRVVVQDKKRVVGVLRTDAHLMGNFDLQSRRQQPAWRIVQELKKQYEVRNLNPTSPIPEDVDVLFVPQISSLPQGGLDNVRKYVEAGKPSLIVADPMPVFNIKLSPTQPMLPPPSQGGMMGGGQPAQEKGDYLGTLRAMGVSWSDTRIVYDTDNPNPRMASAPRHVIFVGEREGKNTFEGGDPIVDGLAQVVTLFSGDLERAEGSDVEFTPLLTTGASSGYDSWEKMVDDSNFLLGLQGPVIPRRKGPMTDGEHVLGARLEGAAGSGEDAASINAIVLADLDMFADSFFTFHEQGGDVDGDGLIDIRFDNVTFLLNCIDTLAGDDRFVELRKRQPSYRRLEKVDEFTREAREKREEEVAAADEEAEGQQGEAQAELDKAVEAIRSRADLDDTTKRIMMRSAEEAENRRLAVRKQQIERDKAKRIDKIDVEFMREVDAVQNRIRLFAILIPPVPALLMGLVLFGRKRRREAATIPDARKRTRGGKS